MKLINAHLELIEVREAYWSSSCFKRSQGLFGTYHDSSELFKVHIGLIIAQILDPLKK